jgi:phenylpropionate dioxygenase-like ring-hydroxylating dioxygenase large terminal subunit
MSSREASAPLENDWDRGGLPVWAYGHEELSKLEKELVFRRNWICAGHVSDVPEPGDYLCFDAADERAIILRDAQGGIGVFHNLCRHRGSRVATERHGHCRAALVCPFHGWSYNLDGSLRTIAAPRSFPDLDRSELGLKPVEFEIWHGLIFVRFKSEANDGASVAETMAPYETEVAAYRIAEMVPVLDSYEIVLDIDWKAVVDIDNEGYHVAIGHPALHQLYGKNYYDEVRDDGMSRSFGAFNETGARLWSVRHYLALLPQMEHLPQTHRRAWLYYSVFPNNVLAYYPDMFEYYQVLPIAPEKCLVRGRAYALPNRSRAMRAVNYLNKRINATTTKEDNNLMIWFREGMKSSAFDDLILSDHEYNVRAYHDQLREIMPVLNLDEPPRRGTLATVNEALTEADGGQAMPRSP